MPLSTTMIGSYPKPAYIPVSDWFTKHDMMETMAKFHQLQEDESLQNLYHKAETEVINEQCDLGISVVTNGEIRRENYYLHLCRNTKGFDFENFKVIGIRNNACRLAAPVIVDRIESCGDTSAWKEWQIAQKLSDRPVKYTLPGPMTILNSVVNQFYDNVKDAREDLIKVINREILGLVEHGCKHIQLDEPTLIRDTTTALQFGITDAERCFQGVACGVEKTLHICCGYPTRLDEPDYPKADPNCYELIADKLDNSIFDMISLEDAWRHNNLALFEKFRNKTLVIGVVKIASSEVESVEEIRTRVEDILKVLPRERLVLAPDCGVGFLADNTLRKTKLRNMVQVAHEF